MKMYVHVFAESLLLILRGYISRRITESRGDSHFQYFFLGTVNMFSIVAEQIYFPTSTQGLQFSYIFVNTSYFKNHYSHPHYSMKWHLLVVLNCISIMTNDIKNSFMCLLVCFISLFGEMTIWVICPLKNWVVYLFDAKL